MSKFECSKCKNIYEINQFKTLYKNNNKIYIDLNTNKEICCENCNNKLQLIQDKENFGIVYSSFSGLSPLEKQKLLRKRSDDDAKKQKYREQDREKDHYNA